MPQIENLISYLDILSNGNEAIKGILMLLIVGVLTTAMYKAFSFIAWIYGLIYKTFTTTMIVNSTSGNFDVLMKDMREAGIVTKARVKTVVGRRWDTYPFTLVMNGIAFGRLYNNFVMIRLNVTETKGDLEIFKCYVTWIGRGDNFIDNFRTSTETNNTNTYSVTEVKKDQTTYFNRDIKPFEMIPILENDGKSILTKIDKFINSEKDYISKGIPYTFGCLLEGASGTGKTKLMGYIIEKLGIEHGYSTYIVNSISTFSKVPKGEKVIIIIDEIDGMLNYNSKDNDSKDGDKQDDDITGGYNKSQLTEFLQELDGVVRSHGRIILSATNSIKDIDSRILRAGRIGHHVNFAKFKEVKSISDLYTRYYGKNINPSEYELKKEVSGSEVMKVYFDAENGDDYLSELLVKK